MLIDRRGSEVLPRSECLRLLAVAARSAMVGRLAVSTNTAPVIHPVDFGFDNGQVVVQLGAGFMMEAAPGRLVAFEVDSSESAGHGGALSWSVLVRGLVTSVQCIEQQPPAGHGPCPTVPEPGDRLLFIRPDVVSGRRFQPRTPSVVS